MKRTLAILLIPLVLAGCGTFSHQQQTYYVKPVSANAPEQPRPIFRAQVVPTTESTHVPLFYYSRKWGEPYSIVLSANSREDVCTHFLLHSFRFKADDQLIDEKQFSVPLKLDLCGSKLGFRNNHTLYRYSLDESFQYVEGREVELEVVYQRSDSDGMRTLLLRGIGEERKRRHSLFSAYMGI